MLRNFDAYRIAKKVYEIADQTIRSKRQIRQKPAINVFRNFCLAIAVAIASAAGLSMPIAAYFRVAEMWKRLPGHSVTQAVKQKKKSLSKKPLLRACSGVSRVTDAATVFENCARAEIISEAVPQFILQTYVAYITYGGLGNVSLIDIISILGSALSLMMVPVSSYIQNYKVGLVAYARLAGCMDTTTIKPIITKASWRLRLNPVSIFLAVPHRAIRMLVVLSSTTYCAVLCREYVFLVLPLCFFGATCIATSVITLRWRLAWPRWSFSWCPSGEASVRRSPRDWCISILLFIIGIPLSGLIYILHSSGAAFMLGNGELPPYTLKVSGRATSKHKFFLRHERDGWQFPASYILNTLYGCVPFQLVYHTTIAAILILSAKAGEMDWAHRDTIPQEFSIARPVLLAGHFVCIGFTLISSTECVCRFWFRQWYTTTICCHRPLQREWRVLDAKSAGSLQKAWRAKMLERNRLSLGATVINPVTSVPISEIENEHATGAVFTDGKPNHVRSERAKSTT